MQRTGMLLCVLALAACNGDAGDILSGGGDARTPDNSQFTTGPDAPFSQRAEHNAVLEPCLLPAGTMGLPDPVTPDFIPDIGSELPGAISAPAPDSFPGQVHLRTDTGTYNRRYQFLLHEGNVWYKPNTEVTGIEGDWAQVPTPPCLAGTLIGISADDDELIGIRENGDVYGLDNILKDPALFNWTSRWGAPLWFGTGYHVQEDYLAWSWTVISNSEDENWTDPAGNLHRVGDGKVSHIWMLRNEGQQYSYIDPWLPHDESYEMCGPLRGRFKGVNLSASGSTIMTINRYGDIFTRHYDFDLAGNNEVFFDYAFEDQRGVSNPKIQLPSPDWVQQPKVPGDITHNISIHKIGKNLIHRIMRVEGLDAEGHTGYWEKDIVETGADDWVFVRTDEPLRGTLLDNSQQDSSHLDVAENEDAHYSRNMAALSELRADMPLESDDDWAGELTNFNLYCSPSKLRIHTAPGESMDLVLHVVDVIRQVPRARGLDDNPRPIRGNIEVPDELLARFDSLSPRQQAFINLYLDGNKFTEVRMGGVTDAISMGQPQKRSGFQWTFNR